MIKHLTIILFLSGSILSQPLQNNFTHFTMRDGLPSNQTGPIIQDHLGYIWIGTNNGITRYDGYEFLNFSVVKEDSNFLQLPITSALYEDSHGDIWIGHVGGISKYIREQKSFKIIFFGEYEKAEDRVFAVTSICETEEGDILLGMADIYWREIENGLYVIKKGSSSVQKIYLGEEHSNIILNISKIDSDKYLVSGAKGLAEYFHKNKSIEWFQLGENHGVASFLVDDSTNIWLGDADRGINYFDRKEQTSEIISLPKKDEILDDGIFIGGIIFDKNNNLYFTSNRGLGQLDRETRKITYANYDIANPAALHSNSLSRIIKDRSGTIWISSNDAGISKYNTVQNNFRSYSHNPNNPNTLDPGWVSLIFEYNESEIWFRSGGTNISVFDKNTNTFKKRDIELPESYIYRDNDNQIWLGTFDGLYKLNINNWTTQNVNIPIDMEDNAINVLLDDSKNNFWVGTYHGLFRYDREQNQTAKIDLVNLGLGTKLSHEVFNLLEDNEQNIWIGTNNGLFQYSYTDQQYTRMGYSKDSTKSFNSQDVNSLYIDTEGIVWVGTWLGGLNKLDPNTGNIKSYTTRDGFNSHSVQGILGDEENGALWLSSFDGISRFDLDKEEFQSFGIDDGIQGNQFAQGSAHKTKDGLFLFGGQNGVTMFRSQNIKSELVPPEVIITDFKIFNESINSISSDVLTKPIYETDNIKLEYDENDISFEFLAVHFANPAQNKYAYRLSNYQDEWRFVGNQRNATYPNLPPGEYVFQVKAANNNNVWNEEGKSIGINILAPWWKTWWAYGSYFLIFVGFLYGGRKIELTRQRKNAEIRENKLRAEAAELESRALQAETERKTKELEEARQLQLSMLPRELPKIPNLDIAVYMKTATEVGGDYYDFHVGLDGTLTTVVGDATGHGMRAGTMVTSTKSLFSSYAEDKDIVKTFHEMTRCYKNMHLDNLSMCMTMLKINGNLLKMSSAGMPPVYIYKKGTSSVEEYLFQGMPLGTMKNFPYEVRETSVQQGDTIVIMSDGFPELLNDENEMIGYKRTKQIIEEVAFETPENIIERFKVAGSEWINDKDPDDDVTFVVIKVK